MKVKCGRAKADPEKAVLPAIVWCKSQVEHVTGYAICLGWWDWYIAFTWASNKR
jgi:hypothetical protein